MTAAAATGRETVPTIGVRGAARASGDDRPSGRPGQGQREARRRGCPHRRRARARRPAGPPGPPRRSRRRRPAAAPGQPSAPVDAPPPPVAGRPPEPLAGDIARAVARPAGTGGSGTASTTASVATGSPPPGARLLLRGAPAAGSAPPARTSAWRPGAARTGRRRSGEAHRDGRAPDVAASAPVRSPTEPRRAGARPRGRRAAAVPAPAVRGVSACTAATTAAPASSAAPQAAVPGRARGQAAQPARSRSHGPGHGRSNGQGQPVERVPAGAGRRPPGALARRRASSVLEPLDVARRTLASTSAWVTPSPASTPASRSVTTRDRGVAERPARGRSTPPASRSCPTTDRPRAACQRDSARVEKRGPLTTTSVPPS